jgi:hypothetical protein
MLRFLIPRGARYTIDHYLESRGSPLVGEVEVIPYDELGDRERFPAWATIFTGLDQISPPERDAAADLHRQLADAGVAALNQPVAGMQRYELLKHLHRTGHNAFDVHRATDLEAVGRFPVFLRDEHLHNGNLTPLLRNHDELRRALTSLMVRGRRLATLLVVEFCDTSDDSGCFRKYSAFRVGDAIIPRYLHAGAHWMLKSETNEVTDALLEEERDYLCRNPHGSWLEQIFRLANLEYGRIDYGILHGRPQVWEINTNPTLTRNPREPSRVDRTRFGDRVDFLRRLFHDRFRSELRRLSLTTADRGEYVVLDAARRRGVRAAARRQRRIDRLAAHVTRLVESRLVQQAKGHLHGAAVWLAPILSRIPRQPS